jgi:thioesterase domain-containing protein
MAQQLHSQEQKVDLLVLLESGAPGAPLMAHLEKNEALLLVELANDHARMRGKDWNISLNEIRELSRDRQVAYVIEKMRAADILPQGIGIEWMRRFLLGCRARIKASMDYLPQVYPGRICLFLSSEKDPEISVNFQGLESIDDELTSGWRKLSSQPVEVYVVPGHHVTMCMEPHVQALAKQLKSCFQENKSW